MQPAGIDLRRVGRIVCQRRALPFHPLTDLPAKIFAQLRQPFGAGGPDGGAVNFVDRGPLADHDIAAPAANGRSQRCPRRAGRQPCRQVVHQPPAIRAVRAKRPASPVLRQPHARGIAPEAARTFDPRLQLRQIRRRDRLHPAGAGVTRIHAAGLCHLGPEALRRQQAFQLELLLRVPAIRRMGCQRPHGSAR